jgi:hypothetical protein
VAPSSVATAVVICSASASRSVTMVRCVVVTRGGAFGGGDG